MHPGDPLFKKPSRLDELLRLISIAQNQGPDTPNPDHLYLKMLKETFHAEGISMILVDLEQSASFTKKESTTGINWKIISNIPSGLSLLSRTLKSTGVLTWTSEQISAQYSQLIDGVEGLKTKNFTSAPIRSHSVILGAVGLINTDSSPFDDLSMATFEMVLTALGDHLYYNQLVRENFTSNSELSTSKAQLLNSRNVLRLVFDSIPQSFYIIDNKYIITAINHARADRIDATPKELFGRLCYEALFGLTQPCKDCLVPTTFSTGKFTHRIATSKNEKKIKLDWEIKSYPILGLGNEIDGVVLIEQDITENRKLEVEILQSEKLAAVGQLAAGIAHEINNPLTAVLVNSQILLEDLPEDQTDNIESVKLIEMAAVRASQVIKNLLALVRKENYEFEPMDLNESIQSALMLVSHEFLTRQINVFFDRAENMPMYMGSTNHLQGVWINLLLNAIEAIDEKKGDLKVTSYYEASTFYVEIRDSGAGISDENLGKIFEPYFTTKRSGQGTGLGLSLVKRTIQAHGGQIMVESNPGEGARFTIILPEEH